MTATAPPRPPRRTAATDPRFPGRQDWSSWPAYDSAAEGFKGYWYPADWSSRITGKPTAVTLCGQKLVLIRDNGTAYAMFDRCPHRGIPLSMGNQQFPGTISCAYHGWTFGLSDGVLKAVITDGPDSPICGKVRVVTYEVAERLGMVWVYVPLTDEKAAPIDDQLPEELRDNDFVMGGRMDDRVGNWRFACENGYDEGHAKYLHRTSLWRLYKTMPTWNMTHIEKQGRWIYRVQDEVHFEATFPGVGTWTNYRWWKQRPPTETFNIGNTGKPKRVNPVIAAQNFPGFASVSMPGVLRIVYPTFIHYEFYVPVDAANHRYVGVMVNFPENRRSGYWFFARYLGWIRWLFHGQFSGQDARMVEATDAPPERLYRPDVSLTMWRQLAQQTVDSRAGDSRVGDFGSRGSRSGDSRSGAAPGRDA